MRKQITFTGFLILIFLTACKPKPSAGNNTIIKVQIEKMQFSPENLEVKKGDTVEWQNNDLTPHTVTSSIFGDSGSLQSGESWQHIFPETGEFPYNCTFHPNMKGTIVVK